MTDPNLSPRRFYGREYIAALQQHYPEFFEADTNPPIDRRLHIGIVRKWIDNLDTLGIDAPDRFQRISERGWTSERSAWLMSAGGTDLRHASVYYSYKGLIHLKPTIDLVLYSNLIWELQPRTILEFGSLQGGSALWLADQLSVLCAHGEVHSFEICDKCISPRASHRQLHFHQADFRDLATLDASLLGGLPHPWLVIDDAHENLVELVPFVAGFMNSGDYYVIEDVFLYHPARKPIGQPPFSADMILSLASACDVAGFVVDTKYADAFGYNVTCSPNGWLVKRP